MARLSLAHAVAVVVAVAAAGFEVTGRLATYCNNPPAATVDEGVPPVPGAKLVQVLANLRHGDRSAIHVLPQTQRIRWPCTAPSAAEAQWAAAVLQPIRSTEACIVDSNCTAMPSDPLPDRIDRAFAAWKGVRDEGMPCGAAGGELSSIGWQQLQTIGVQLADTYGDLLARDDPATTALRVVSTDTGRTTLSATALVRGLLHGLYERASRRAAAVAVGADGSQSASGDGAAGRRSLLLGGGRRGSSSAGSGSGGGGGSALEACPGCYLPQDVRHAHSNFADEALQLAANASAAHVVVPAIGAAAGAGAEEAASSGSPLLLRPVPQLSLPLPLHVVHRHEDPMMFAKLPHVCPAAQAMEDGTREMLWKYERTPAAIARRIVAMAGLLPSADQDEEEAAAVTAVAAAPQLVPEGEDPAPPSPSPAAVVDPVALVPGTEAVVDDLYTRLCHGQPLPCWTRRIKRRNLAAAAVQDEQPVSEDSNGGDAAGSAVDAAGDASGEADVPACCAAGSMMRSDVARRLKQRGNASEAVEAVPSGRWHEFGTLTLTDGSAPAAVGDADADPDVFAASEDDVAAVEAFLDRAARDNSGAGIAKRAALPVEPTAQPAGADEQLETTCLEIADAIAMFDRGDRLYASRFGSPSTQLLTYPFFAQVLRQLQNAARRVEGVPRFVVRAAHDTVISPVLSSLGLVDRPFSWPGYAARVLFELWQAPSGSRGTDADESFLIRIVYNGHDITPQTLCATLTAAADASASDSGVCSLAAFARFVRGLIAPARRWEEACTVPPAEP